MVIAIGEEAVDKINSSVAGALPNNLEVSRKKIYLDSFVYSHIAKDGGFTDNVRRFITNQGFALICSAVNLIEIYPNKKRLIDVCKFISSVPFAIIANPDEVVAQEVRSYPAPPIVPIGFVSENTPYSSAELAESIKDNLERKINLFQKTIQQAAEQTFSEIIKKRDSGIVAFTEPEEIKLFLMSSVLSMLYPEHKKFLESHILSGVAIEVEQFRTFHTQALAIFIDYYEQKKKGKRSDVGDYLQLGYVPYMDLAVFDNERADTVGRMNKKGLSQPLNCLSFGEFRKMCGPG